MSRFEAELRRLPDVYSNALVVNESLGALRRSLAQRCVVFVGSGGALAVADFAAQLHRLVTRRPARADTPLGLTSESHEDNAAAVLFSAGGRNPDVRSGARAARLAGYSPVVVISCRAPGELPDSLLRHVDSSVHIQAAPDGFLATSSVVAMTTALAIAYGFDLPAELLFDTEAYATPLRERTIAVGGVPQRAPIVDLEARLSETGLSAIQIADLRNFAHGRHVGLARNLENTTVLVFSDTDTQDLAARTGKLLPDGADLRQISSALRFPASAIEMFGHSMHLTAVTGSAKGLDPAKPGVERFGRDLYRLAPGRSQTLPKTGPVDRKLAAMSAGESHRSLVQTGLQSWLASLRTVSLTSLVLDYDGTCCPTERRFDPPSQQIAALLGDLSRSGLQIAFASGRGRSLHEEARRWIPKQSWATTWIGLYNGGAILSLADEVGDFTAEDPVLRDVADRLEKESDRLGLMVERRLTQVGVTSREFPSGLSLLPIVAALLEQHPAPGVTIAASGHSVDVVKAGTSKRSVIDHLHSVGAGAVLAIGDQGQPSGNDFELLARTPWSLSVDQISADLSRCWNLGVAPDRGPELLLRYLKSLVRSGNEWRFKWKASK